MSTHTTEHATPEDDMPEDTEPARPAPDEGTTDANDAGTDGAGTDGAGTDGEGRIGTQAGTPADEGKPAPFYARLEDFVDGHFLPLVRRPLGGEFRWCAQWWRHAEAISRLTALWHAWEALRRQPGTGIGLWYRDHLDHQLAYLLGPRGPFFQCSEDEHIEPRRLRSEPAPPDWWR